MLLTSCVSEKSNWSCFIFNNTATTNISTLSLHDALPISISALGGARSMTGPREPRNAYFSCGGAHCPVALGRSEEHTSELQSRRDLVCRLLLEKKKDRFSSDVILCLFSSLWHWRDQVAAS